MKRIVYALLATVSGLVLLFSYRTSLPEDGRRRTAERESHGRHPRHPGSGVAVGRDLVDHDDPRRVEFELVVEGDLFDDDHVEERAHRRHVHGSAVNTRYGAVQVRITVSGGVITDVQTPAYPDHSSRDRQINEDALPQLISETLSAQSAQIDMVSGATYTSTGYLDLAPVGDRPGLGMSDRAAAPGRRSSWARPPASTSSAVLTRARRRRMPRLPPSRRSASWRRSSRRTVRTRDLAARCGELSFADADPRLTDVADACRRVEEATGEAVQRLLAGRLRSHRLREGLGDGCRRDGAPPAAARDARGERRRHQRRRRPEGVDRAWRALVVDRRHRRPGAAGRPWRRCGAQRRRRDLPQSGERTSSTRDQACRCRLR
jgi:hypothetical protein